MESNGNRVKTDRAKFVEAIMTKDYSKAIDLGTSIMMRDPNDHLVNKCLVALEKFCKFRKIKLSDSRASSSTDKVTVGSTSGMKGSDEAGSRSDDTDDKINEEIIDLGASLLKENLFK